MSLGTRLTLKTAVLVLAVVVVAGVALWGLGGLNRDLGAALGEYDRLREAYGLLSEVEQARSNARDGRATSESVERALLKPILHLDELDDGPLSEDLRMALRRDLTQAISRLPDELPDDGTPLDVLAPIYKAMTKLSGEIEAASDRIEAIEQDATAHRKRVVLGVGVTAGLAALLAIIVGVWQYGAVMRPLRRLQRGVDRLASGDFADRLAATGDREFATLATDFNRMADDLATVYRDLEDKVRLRSSQLAQSERLASVGFLAAGVAHEINNPLAIIAGEAELALSALPDDAEDASRQTLTAIRDEAFRCKGITQKLLSLARPGSGERETVDVVAIAQSVGSLVLSLPQAVGRAVTVEGDPRVMADTEASQVKQVLLNLVINALEAVEAGAGQVRVQVQQREGAAVLAVHDNGKGLSTEQIERVFEPFYTEKKSPTTPGLGLGLSISHAIVEDLGGRLTAASNGAGRGSVFTIELPTADGGTTQR